MPWSHTSPMDQTTPFIADSLRERLSVPELCELYGVSRQTGSTGLARSLMPGPQGLAERSRRPSPSPRHPPDQVVAALLAARGRHPSWGAKELVSILSKRPPRWPWPARSTGWDMRRRHGLGPQKRMRRVIGHPGQPTRAIAAPHDVWSAACPGPCKPGDGHDGEPLPITEGYRRSPLRCPALSSTSGAGARPVFRRGCQAFGRPRRLRTDNGVPCATHPLARLSQLSAGWVRLGSLPEVIAPGQPPQDGGHARRPRTLNADTTRPPGATLRAQPQKCNPFREACNQARPPEALARRTPAACSAPSPRALPHNRPPLASPDRFAGRSVSAHGGSRWPPHWGNVSPTGVGEDGGLEDSDAGVWKVSCGPRNRGRLHERHRRSEAAYGRRKRRR